MSLILLPWIVYIAFSVYTQLLVFKVYPAKINAVYYNGRSKSYLGITVLIQIYGRGLICEAIELHCIILRYNPLFSQFNKK